MFLLPKSRDNVIVDLDRPSSTSAFVPNMARSRLSVLLTLAAAFVASPTYAVPDIDRAETCEILIVGGGLAGVATAYESLLAGRTVCMTEITDWVGGQISSQGTSALDERPTQRELLYYPRGYLDFRSRIEEHYGILNPGQCWVSLSCFLPEDGHEILLEMLAEAEDEGDGELKWFPATVVKDLELNETGTLITSAIAIQRQPAPGAPPLNTEPLSQVLLDAYSYEDSAQFTKNIIQFVPQTDDSNDPIDWYVVEATETGEIIALADVPYSVGIDPRSFLEPSASSKNPDPYCTQGFTYTFAMEATADPQEHEKPEFYDRYEEYYSYDEQRFASLPLLFSYRSIWRVNPFQDRPGNPRNDIIDPGDISMQNWTWGNDYRPGTAADNLVYSRQQLQELGQLAPGGWQGGLRVETLEAGEELARGFFYWLVESDRDPKVGDEFKEPHPNYRYMEGLDSPMGTVHGLSKYPYIREGRRIIGRPSWGYPEGFAIAETDISRQDYSQEFYDENLTAEQQRLLRATTAGLDAIAVLTDSEEDVQKRSRSVLFPDSVGVAHYAIDFHPCMEFTPPEAPGNIERPGERQGAGEAYPFQIPLRAMIPQRIDNLIVAGKSIATSHIAAAAYRVHSFEWAAGAAAGVAIDFALENNTPPYEWVDELPRQEPQLEALQRRLVDKNNPIAFPDTSIFNNDWEDWR